MQHSSAPNTLKSGIDRTLPVVIAAVAIVVVTIVSGVATIAVVAVAVAV